VLSRARPYLPTAVFAILIVYFAFHALTGDKGLLTEKSRESTLSARTVQLARLQAERRDLEARVTLLKTNNLSRDLLEERARVLLGFSDPRDYVIRTEAAPPAQS
jgi:cell division protein FtsB